MKYLNCLIACLLFVTLTSCQSSKNESMENKDGEKVKTITHYLMEDGVKIMSSVEYFNKNGNKENEIYFIDTKEYLTTYKYDDNNDLIEKIEYDSDGTADDWKKYQYEYDGKKLVKKITFDSYHDDGVFMKFGEINFKYNENKQLVHELSIGIIGEFEYEYSYHPNGEMQKKITYAYEGTEKIFTDYNEEGKRVKEEVFRRKDINMDFESDFIITWVYNENGTTTKTKSRNGKEETKIMKPVDSSLKPVYTYY